MGPLDLIVVVAASLASSTDAFTPSQLRSPTLTRQRSSYVCVYKPFRWLKSVGRWKPIFVSENADDDVKSDTITDQNESNEKTKTVEASKREMLRFAIPALGIYLTNPLLSNIDNAFVGRTVGPAGLASLSPATLCTDQMLYLFSFLSRATTGLVARAYYSASDRNADVTVGGGEEGTVGNLKAARNAASPPFTVSILCGIGLSVFYAFFTPTLLQRLNVDPLLRPAASSYVHWRGTVAWAALAQSVCLSLFMVTKDAVTPLKIVGFSALANFILDGLFCAWPLRGGCAGAAAATAIATLLSSTWMASALHKRKLLPKLCVPSRQELLSLLEFTGPLLAITLTRLAGFLNMQRTAMKMGVTSLAGYQLSINLVAFFLFFGEPLSQLCQTKLPPLIDSKDGDRVRATLRSILTLSSLTALSVGGCAYFAALLGSGLFSSDIGVQAVARSTAPMVFLSVTQAIFTVAIDGAMMASRDFKFMLGCGLSSFLLQIQLLKRCTTIGGIFNTFTLRLGIYSLLSILRVATGQGALGRVMKRGKRKKEFGSV